MFSLNLGNGGQAIGLGLVALAAVLPLIAMALSSKWDGHLYDQRGCVDVKVVGDRVFKANSCTGLVEEIPQPSALERPHQVAKP